MAFRLDMFKNIVAVNFGGLPDMVLSISYTVVDASSGNLNHGEWSGSIPLVYWADAPFAPNPDPGEDTSRAAVDVKPTVNEAEGQVNSFDVTLVVNPDDPFQIEWQAQLFLYGPGPFPDKYGPDPISNWGRFVGRVPPPWGEGGMQTLTIRWHRSAPDGFEDGFPGTPYLEVITEPPDVGP